MAVTLQFVDKVDANPTLRLDLNAAPWSLQLEGTDFGFPDLDRAVVSTLTQDGAQVPASAYGLRTLTLRLLVKSTSADAVATEKQKLFRELNRRENFLKFAPNTSSPVFFRTYRSAAASSQPLTAGAEEFLTVSVLAEPFALGLRETLADVTVNNDPAAATNPNYWDITDAKGDVEAPLLIEWSTTGASSTADCWAVRRRGTPANVPYFVQCESMTLGTDASLVAGGLYSGTGNNAVRVSFATSTAMVNRASLSAHPATPSVDVRGTYRVFLHAAKSVGTDVIDGRIAVGPNFTPGTTTSFTVNNTGPYLQDLGLVQFPVGADPATVGPSGAESTLKGAQIQIHAQRVSGTGTLDLDYLLFVPADDNLVFSDTSAFSGSPNWVFDTGKPMIYGVTPGTTEVTPTGAATLTSQGPHITPGVTNRIYYLRRVGQAGDGHSIVGSTVFTVSYWPRYLHIRPVSS